ncbi:MAG: SAM-dependent methyltransferase [Planctomycetota bacterium]
MGMPDPSQYDSFAGAYGDFAETAPYNALYDRPATLELIGDVSGLRVLDAACGPGIYLETLRAGGADVSGFDGSREMVEVARGRVGAEVPLRVHSMDDPLDWIEDGSLDLVVCALAYHYVDDRLGFLKEVHRVLRPGGGMVISTSHPTNDWVRLGGSYFTDAPVTETWSRGWVITAVRCPLGRLTAEFAEAGFLIERLVEPLPMAEMASTHPEAFEKLSSQPGFILFRLLKR